MMKKARVAPMNFQEQDKEEEKHHNDPIIEDVIPLNNNNNNNTVTHYFDYKNILGKKHQEDNENDTWFGLVDRVAQKATNITQNKWRKFTNTVRQINKVTKTFEKIREELLKDKQRLVNAKNLNSQCLLENHKPKELAAVEQFIKQKRHKEIDDNDWLVRYFIDLSENIWSDEVETGVDFDLLEKKFASGVDVNFVDKYGQSILHEVARLWHVDVAQFLISHGANINCTDVYGRTPLHVAAAVDYPEMIEFLLAHGADITSRTIDENQTPIHYAAQNDAGESLKMLLHYGADMDVRDYKGRTPLQLAAELDRSTTAELLIEQGAPAGVYDDNKLSAMVVMIQKMPGVALKALDQFYQTSNANRKQYFYLNFLVPPTEAKTCFAKSPLEVAVEYKQYQLLLHPIFQRLVEVKWQRLGKWGAIFTGGLNLIMCLLWTVRLCLIPVDATKTYESGQLSVSAVFDVLAVLAVVCLFIGETQEYFKAKRITERYKEWREEQLQNDLKFAHPRWPEERAYVEREIRANDEYTSSYFRDRWNFLDWSTQILMIATIVLHIVNMKVATKNTNAWFRMVASVTLLSMWLRLLKYARPFKSVGLFVVMLSHVITDTLKILFLSLHIFIPYTAAFYMVFGVYGVKGYTLKNFELLYNMFQIGVVGDYNNEGLEKHSPIQFQLLVGTFIFFGGIVLLNLFIALLSDTFQRVYDNAKATAQMQRAAAILDIEANLSEKRLRKHNEWIIRHCSPETLYYDDDAIEEETTALKKMTHQIRERVETMHDIMESKYGDAGNILNQSSISLRTTEQFSARENKDVKYLVESVNELRAEFHKSTIQTRAEIAGLGLMMKDLIETTQKTKRKNKTKLPEIGKKTTSTDTSFFTGGNQHDHIEEIEKPHGEIQKSSGGKEISSKDTSKNKVVTESKNQSNVRKNTSTPENDFYEGYTFPAKNSTDALIKRTWGSIFTRMMDQKGNDGEDEEETSSSTVQLVKHGDDLNPNASFNI